ncbi:MAG: 2-amino-4-hydroxy-6-hydroxymethyldihydropteridine diphosphokinase [Bacteroidaceae bacterium]|nr:2-amino-4-hydroxy-6-hydroxymethyldihydropteridine diphosphokinase [Bacteroidaceae bacterium]
MVKVYFGIGSNLGNKLLILQSAINKIKNRIGEISSLSDFYTSSPWGFSSTHQFLNAVLCIETKLSPLEILHITKDIEKELGRTEKSIDGKYQDRLIDIDLLLYGDLIFSNQELIIPHPQMVKRRFVMEPMAEIAPGLLHPILKKTMTELFQETL